MAGHKIDSAPESIREGMALTWFAKKSEPPPKSVRWYLTTSGVGIVAIATVFYLGNTLFALVLLLGIGTLLLRNRRPVASVHYRISVAGVQIGKRLYSFDSLDSFWIDEHSNLSSLILKTNNLLTPTLEFPIVDVEPETVGTFLKRFVKEQKPEVSLSEHLGRVLGF